MNSSDYPARRRYYQPQQRPQTISELSERALQDLYDEAKPLKHFLRIAERYRKDARDYNSKGDLENAFINFARAAALVLEKLPTHREYYTLLTTPQRSNLSLNGTDILEELGNLERKLTKRYEDWVRDHPEGEQPEPPSAYTAPDRYQEVDSGFRRVRSKGKERERGRHDHHRRISEDYALWRQDEHLAGDIEEIADREWRRHAHQGSIRDRGVVVTSPQTPPRVRQAKKEAAITAARQAQVASVSNVAEAPDYTFSRPPLRSQNGQPRIHSNPDGPDMSDDRKRYAEIERQYQYEQQQKEMRHREEEILRKREEMKRRKDEDEGIMRQQQADEAARVARSASQRIMDVSEPRLNTLSAQGSVASIASASSLASTAPSTLFPPTSASSSAVTTPSSFYQNSAASSSTMMQQHSAPSHYVQSSSHRLSPSPSPYYASTAPTQPRVSAPGSSSTQVIMPSSSIYAPPGSSSTMSYYAPTSSSSQPAYQNPGSSLTSVMYTNTKGPNALPEPPVIPKPPLTRSEVAQTSHRPPSMMDSGPTLLPLEPARLGADSTDSESTVNERERHQSIGYANRFDYDRTPTRRKTRSPSPVTTTSPPLPQQRRSIEQIMSQHQRSQGYYPSTDSMFSSGDSSAPYQAVSGPQYGEVLHNHHPRIASSASFRYQSPQRPLPQPSSYAPTSQPAPPSHLRPRYPDSHQRTTSAPVPTPPIIQTPPRSQPHRQQATYPNEKRILKPVTVPKDCLQKFLGIASANTAVNKETCGLLLGKDKGNKYAVTTLLIPKQHSTSDTCTMDEEELVLQFTEERSLITLGWIHTHPSQSCFMSSVDLHTHSGFQRMLPESFAIVCAPKSKPNFGIFRLTEPPGLKTILDCKAKDAFHPHPDLPIYTDADKGHVQMKEGLLEIVDLR